MNGSSDCGRGNKQSGTSLGMWCRAVRCSAGQSSASLEGHHCPSKLQSPHPRHFVRCLCIFVMNATMNHDLGCASCSEEKAVLVLPAPTMGAVKTSSTCVYAMSLQAVASCSTPPASCHGSRAWLSSDPTCSAGHACSKLIARLQPVMHVRAHSYEMLKRTHVPHAQERNLASSRARPPCMKSWMDEI